MVDRSHIIMCLFFRPLKWLNESFLTFWWSCSDDDDDADDDDDDDDDDDNDNDDKLPCGMTSSL